MEKVENFLENLKQVDLTKIDWQALLSWDYLTDPNPKKHFIYEQWIYVIALLNLIFAVIIFRFVGNKFFTCKPKYRLIRKTAFLWFVDTIFLLLYNLLRSEGVSFLSMRLFLIIIISAYLGIAIYLLVCWIKFLPKRIEKFNEARLRDKYTKRK